MKINKQKSLMENVIDRRNFRLVLIGLIISLFGSAIQRFSFSLYLLDVTRDAAVFSNVMAFSVLPFVFLAPLAGTVADKFNKKRIMICLDLLSAACIVLYMLLYTIFDTRVLMTAIVMFILSSINAFYTPAVTAMIPVIVKEERLIRANALVSQVGSVANLAGPVLAGLLYGLLGIRGVTILNGISFFGSAILEMFILFSNEKKKEGNHISIKSSLIEMKDSYQYLKSEKPIVLRFIHSYCVFNLCLVPVMTILLPYVLRTQLKVSAQGYGVIEGIIAGGMIAGAFVVGVWPDRFRVSKIYQWDYLLVIAITWMLFISMSVRESSQAGVYAGIWTGSNGTIISWTICCFVIMAALGIGNVVTLSYTQKIIDAGHLGKVSAFSTAVATVSVPVGQLIFGWYLRFFSNVILLLGVVVILNLLEILSLKKCLNRANEKETL